MNLLSRLIIITLIVGGVSCSDSSTTGANNQLNGDENNIEISPKGTEKLNILVDVFNSFSTDSYDAYDDYVSSFGDDSSKFVKNKDWYSGDNIHESTVAKLKNLNKATEIEVYSELNPLIISYQSTALHLAKQLNESYPYFDMKDYETDNFEKAKAWHKPILIAFNDFFYADNVLRKKSDSIQNELELVYLADLKERGDILNYLVGMSINKAEKMLNATQADEYENLDIISLETAHDEVRDIFDELTQLKINKPDEFNENHQMSWFYNALKDFIKSAKELCNRKKENRPFSTGEKMNLNPSSGWMVNGSTYQVLKKYNELINKYNIMIN